MVMTESPPSLISFFSTSFSFEIFQHAFIEIFKRKSHLLQSKILLAFTLRFSAL